MASKDDQTRAVYSKGGEMKGMARPRGFRCQLEGCTGERLSVKWPDGKFTRPCTKGMFTRPDGDLQIG